MFQKLSTFSSVVVWTKGEIASKRIHFERKESVRTGEYKTKTLEWASIFFFVLVNEDGYFKKRPWSRTGLFKSLRLEEGFRFALFE